MRDFNMFNMSPLKQFSLKFVDRFRSLKLCHSDACKPRRGHYGAK